ncbi:hypothetical protein ID866_6051 [Astraeus odoratus]|nr:hypothetical protein ID866_6051 [Astraeus odoratus]
MKCDEAVNPENCRVHLARAHGISNLPGYAIVSCRWCHPRRRMKRESILRHTKEVHLKIRRSKTGRK